MILGLLPELGGGLRELARTGQHMRFVDGYLRPYARAFDEVRYFSYARETLADFTRDAELGARVSVVPGPAWPGWLSTLALGVRQRRALRDCAVLRVFQLTGAIPAPPERRSTVPDTRMPSGFSPLAAASASRLRPARAAIAVNVSPGWTTYAPALVAAVVAVAPASSASLSPSPPPAVLVTAGAAGVGVEPGCCGGIWMVDPAISWAVGESPFAEASWDTLSPSAAAIEDNGSPGAMTWTK